MVTETTPGAAELDDEIDDLDAGFATDEEEVESPEDTTAEEQEADPLADIRSALEALQNDVKPLKDLNPGQIGPALGRIAKMQSEIDRLSKVNPTAEIDPRLETAESLTRSLAQALIANDLVDDASKVSLRDILAKDETARTQRELDRRVEAAVSKATGNATSSTAEAPEPTLPPEWLDAQDDITAIAQKNGIPLNEIPWTAAQATGSPIKAVRHVEAWIEGRKPPAADQVEARKQAAGGGSPSRSGSASNVEHDLERLRTEGIPLTDKAARQRAAADLGVTLEE